MTFDRIDRQFRKRETVLGLPALTSTPIQFQSNRQLFDVYEFQISGYGMLSAIAVGSRCTCDPAPIDTDQDWLAFESDLFSDRLEKLDNGLQLDGWTLCGGEDKYPDMFQSWRRGDDNLIVADSHYYAAFKAASVLAKRFNLLNKKDRIDLFHAVRFGNLPSDE